MTQCPECDWPLEVHDRDYRFSLPDKIAQWTPDDLEAGVTQLDEFLHVRPDEFFMRVLLPVRLRNDHVIVFGPWMEVERETMLRAGKAWNSPTYEDLTCEGHLANALPPWPEISLGAPLVVAPRVPNELPYARSSTDAAMERILAEAWPHDLVLQAINPERPTGQGVPE